MRYFLLLTLLCFGCQSTPTVVWEDTKTIGRYVKRQGSSLFNRDTQSKQLHYLEEFQGPAQEEFIALQEDDLENEPKLAPATPSRPVKKEIIPTIHQFEKPQAKAANVLQNLHFDTDAYTLHAKEDIAAVEQIFHYLRNNPNVHLYILGHCDERASEEYNLALGTRRAHHVRNLLIKKGIDETRLQTISYGKEKPLYLEHTPEAWRKNRRVEFKIHNKKKAVR